MKYKNNHLYIRIDNDWFDLTEFANRIKKIEKELEK